MTDDELVRTIFKNHASSGFIFIEPVSGLEILTTPYCAIAAELEINKTLMGEGVVFLNDYLMFLGQDPIYFEDYNHGWNIECLAQNGYSFIDVKYDIDRGDDDSIRFKIYYNTYPCAGVFDCYNYGDVAC